MGVVEVGDEVLLLLVLVNATRHVANIRCVHGGGGGGGGSGLCLEEILEMASASCSA